MSVRHPSHREMRTMLRRWVRRLRDGGTVDQTLVDEMENAANAIMCWRCVNRRTIAVPVEGQVDTWATVPCPMCREETT